MPPSLSVRNPIVPGYTCIPRTLINRLQMRERPDLALSASLSRGISEPRVVGVADHCQWAWRCVSPALR
jgi:hypothetical protein